jgi:hypothetical protein
MADTITISARGPEVGRAVDSAAAAKRDAAFPVTQAGAPAATRSAPNRTPHPEVGTIVAGIGAIVLIAAIVPIATGFKNLIGLLILAVALFEAWRLNRRATRSISGPYRLAPAEG